MYNLGYFVAFCTVLLEKFVFSLSIYAVLSQNCFVRFTHFCVEKNLGQKSARGEKMTNIRYEYKCTSTSVYVGQNGGCG